MYGRNKEVMKDKDVKNRFSKSGTNRLFTNGSECTQCVYERSSLGQETNHTDMADTAHF